jgi:hypothetical protein
MIYSYLLITQTFHLNPDAVYTVMNHCYYKHTKLLSIILNNGCSSLVFHSIVGTLYTLLRLKLSHYMPRRRLGERRYSSYSFSTPALDGGEWLSVTPRPRFSPGERTPGIVQEAEWAPEPVWTQRLEEKSFRLCRGSNLNRPVVQSVARHYTD